MKVSTKIIYGLQFLMHLMEIPENEILQVKDVVRKEGMSEKYLENIISQLKAAGLLIVKRGAKGGYKLSKAAKDISFREIFDALDGTDLLPDNFIDDKTDNSIYQRAVLNAIVDLEKVFRDTLEKQSLENLEKYKTDIGDLSFYQI